MPNDDKYPYYYYDNKRLQDYINKLIEKLATIIKDKKDEHFNEIDVQISGLMYLLTSFMIQVALLYPLKNTIEYMKQAQPGSDETIIKNTITYIDLTCKQSFVAMTGFSLETILKEIAKKFDITLNDGSVSKRYIAVMRHFGIETGERDALLDIFYWTRNTLHNGGRVTQEGHRSYKGQTFDFVVNEEMKHAEWEYFTYFISEIINIIIDIFKSPKFTAAKNN